MCKNNSFGADIKPLANCRRERGLFDTLLDFSWWLTGWANIFLFFLPSPASSMRAIFSYRCLGRFLFLCALPDAPLEEKNGQQLRTGHLMYNKLFLYTAGILRSLSDGGFPPERLVFFDSMAAGLILSGFPKLKAVPSELMHCGFDMNKSLFIGCEDGDRAFHSGDNFFELRPGAVMGCVRYIEEKTGLKFSWDKFFEEAASQNKLTRLLNDPAADTHFRDVLPSCLWYLKGCFETDISSPRAAVKSIEISLAVQSICIYNEQNS